MVLHHPRAAAALAAGALIAVPVLAGCSSGSQPEVSLVAPSGSPTAASSAAPTADAAQPTDPTASAPADGTPTPRHHAATAGRVKVTVTRTVRAATAAGATPAGTAPATAAAPTATPSHTSAIPDVATVVRSETDAVQGVTSLHVVGTVTTKGETFGVDMRLGTDGEGTLSFGAKGTIGVRRVGDALFLQADDAFFTAHGHPELSAPFRGKWMPIRAADSAYPNIVPLTKLANWEKLVESAPATADAAGTPVGGRPTIAVTGGTGAKANTLLLSSTAPTLPLLTQSADKLDQIQFEDWNAPVGAAQTPALTDQKHEPADELVDVPAFAEETAAAFSKLWHS